MALIKKYRCLNIGNCANANDKKKIFEIAEGEEQCCPECHSTMIVEVKSLPITRYAAIAGGVIVAGGIIAAAAAFWPQGESKGSGMQLKDDGANIEVVDNDDDSSDNTNISAKETTDEETTVATNAAISISFAEGTALELKAGEEKLLNVLFAPQGAEPDAVVWRSSDEAVATVTNGMVKAVKAGTAEIIATTQTKALQAKLTVTVKGDNSTQTTSTPKSGRGTIDLGYGTYTGDLKNGKPHGHGKLTYKTSQKVIPSSSVTANAGDVYDGEFRDGKPQGGGYLQRKNGNEEYVK